MLLLATAARAQLRLGTVEVEAARPNEEKTDEDDAVPFVTIIDAKKPSARVASVADLLERQAGVQVRSRGGLGSFTSVSLRGSDSAEIAIFVDGVPLSRSASGTIDLSLLPVDGLDRVEIWRGVPPIELGSEAVGGAINLITKKGGRSGARASAGVGSFGARSVSAGLSTGGKLRADATLAYRGATGDFSYYDTNQTQALGDDHLAIRHNNGFDQLAADVSVGPSSGKPTWRFGAHGFWKRQGVPGTGSTGAESLNAKLDTSRAIVDGELNHFGSRLDSHLRAFVAYERSFFTNPYGEMVGPLLPSVFEGVSVSAGLTGRIDIPWGRHQLWTLAADARVEHRRTSDLLQPSKSGFPSTRGIGGLAVADDLRFFGDRLALQPALRLDGAVSTLLVSSDRIAIPGQHRGDWFLSPRLSLRGRVTEWLTLRGSAGRFVRFPTLLELFGDGAFIQAEPQLLPESAWGGDAGFSLTFEKRKFGLSLEGVFFGRLVDDYIAYVVGPRGAITTNVGSARVLGSEARLAFHAQQWLLFTLDYTFTDPIDLDSGHLLPGKSRHQLGLHAELRGGPFRLFYELDYLSDTYRDTSNYNLVVGRALHAIGATLIQGGWSLALEVRNLADLRVVDMPLGGTINQGKTTPYPLVDYFDYPLPGRAVYLTAAYQR
jgi:iron complex outermembrane receptor protein